MARQALQLGEHRGAEVLFNGVAPPLPQLHQVMAPCPHAYPVEQAFTVSWADCSARKQDQ